MTHRFAPSPRPLRALGLASAIGVFGRYAAPGLLGASTVSMLCRGSNGIHRGSPTADGWVILLLRDDLHEIPPSRGRDLEGGPSGYEPHEVCLLGA